jgi:Mn-dependent DtxR family transcriptional regulator
VSDEFLNNFYQMTSGEYKILDKYKVGSKLGLSNSQTDDIVDDLHNIGLIKKIGMSKILMTFEGKKEVEESS